MTAALFLRMGRVGWGETQSFLELTYWGKVTPSE